jgi:hypothetical protein
VKKLAVIVPLATLALAACGQGEPEPAPTPTVAAAPAKPTLPPPNEELFAEVFAKTCPDAEKVATSVCKRAGMGSDTVDCQFGVGEDENLRHKASLMAENGEWKLVDAATICAEHNSHHVDS